MARRDSVASEYLANMGTIETVTSKYEEVPDDLLQALDALAEQPTETKAKQKFFTIYDQYNQPRQIEQGRLQQMLQARNQKTGERFFYAKMRPDAPQMLGTTCDVCQRPIKENPHMIGRTPPPKTDYERTWREDVLLYAHYYKRHRPFVPQRFPDKERRDELHRYMAQ